MLAMALMLLCQDAKDFTKDRKEPWSGFAVGSWAKFKVTSHGPTMDDKGKMSTKEIQSESKSTVAKLSGEFAKIEVESGESKNTVSHFIGTPSEYQGTPKKVGEEELAVGEKKYTCTVYEISKSIKTTTQVLKVWKCADVPVWAIREEWSNANNGRTNAGWEEAWTGTETLRVAGKDLVCQVFRKTTKSAGVTVVETTWRNDEVPGRVAKRTRQSFMNEKEVKVGTGVEELIEFEKK